MKKSTTKKIKCAIPILLIVLFLVSITGCTSEESTTSMGNSSGNNAGKSKTIDVSARGIAVPQISQYSAPKAGYVYHAYEGTVKNVNANDRWIGASYWQLRDTAGGVYQIKYVTITDSTKEFESVDSQPGDVVTGALIFETPQGVTTKSLTYDDGWSKVTIGINPQ